MWVEERFRYACHEYRKNRFLLFPGSLSSMMTILGCNPDYLLFGVESSFRLDRDVTYLLQYRSSSFNSRPMGFVISIALIQSSRFKFCTWLFVILWPFWHHSWLLRLRKFFITTGERERKKIASLRLFRRLHPILLFTHKILEVKSFYIKRFKSV